MPDHEFARLCGWTPGHPGRPAVQASIPTLYRAAGPDLGADRSKSVLLYKIWREVFSDYPDYPAQQIGDCTSFGHAHAHDLLQTIEAYLGDLDASAIGRTCTEAWYAAGRECARMLGGPDGCYGSALLKAARTTGVLRYADLPENMREYSGRRARAWGRTGLTHDLAAIAGGRKLQGAMLESVDDMIAALQGGHPCTVSTAIGFSMTRDRQGFCAPQGRWGHCMACLAYRADRPGFMLAQSWGPDRPQGPLDLAMPSWSFWVDLAVMERIIAEGDSDTLSATPGFAPRALPGSVASLS